MFAELLMVNLLLVSGTITSKLLRSGIQIGLQLQALLQFVSINPVHVIGTLPGEDCSIGSILQLVPLVTAPSATKLDVLAPHIKLKFIKAALFALPELSFNTVLPVLFPKAKLSRGTIFGSVLCVDLK